MVILFKGFYSNLDIQYISRWTIKVEMRTIARLELLRFHCKLNICYVYISKVFGGLESCWLWRRVVSIFRCRWSTWWAWDSWDFSIFSKKWTWERREGAHSCDLTLRGMYLKRCFLYLDEHWIDPNSIKVPIHLTHSKSLRIFYFRTGWLICIAFATKKGKKSDEVGFSCFGRAVYFPVCSWPRRSQHSWSYFWDPIHCKSLRYAFIIWSKFGRYRCNIRISLY